MEQEASKCDNLLKERVFWPTADPCWVVLDFSGTAVAWFLRVKSKRETRAAFVEECKASLAELARMVRQITEQHDLIRPLVVILDDQSDRLRDVWRHWASDSDWHRGDFLLFVPERWEEVEDQEQGCSPINFKPDCFKDISQQLSGPFTKDLVPEGWQDQLKERDAEWCKEELMKKLKSDSLAHWWASLLFRERRKEDEDEIEDDSEQENSTWEFSPQGVGEIGKSLAQHLEDFPFFSLNGRVECDIALSQEDESDQEEKNTDTKSVHTLKGIITRIKRITLNNFQGFIGHHELNVDADIVLVAGPNGHGKSSLLRALGLMTVGGMNDSADFASRDLNGREKGTDDGSSEKKDCLLSGHVAAEIETQPRSSEDDKEITIKASWSAEDSGRRPVIEWENCPSLHELNRRGQKEAPIRDLLNRMTLFLQDQVEWLFDEAARGSTLQQLYNPPVLELEGLLKCLKELSDRLNGAIWEAENINERLAEEAGKFIGALGEVEKVWQWAKTADNAALRELIIPFQQCPWPGEGADWSAYAQLMVDFVEAVGGDLIDRHSLGLGKRFYDVLSGQIDRINKQFEKEEGAQESDVAESIKIKRALEEHNNRFPYLENMQEILLADGKHPGLYGVFKAIAEKSDNWIRVLRRFTRESGLKEDDPVLSGLADVRHELERLDKNRAAMLLETVEGWVRKVEAEVKKKADLERELAELQARRRQSGTRPPKINDNWVGDWEKLAKVFDDAETLKNQEGQNGLKKAKQMQVELQQLLKAIEELTAPNRDLLCAVQQLLTLAVWRFSRVPGLLPARLELDEKGERWVLKTADGRQLNELSTGQKGQFGLGMLVAQNLYAGEKLPHRVLILDDFSSSYDQSNLVREALLWRQLAYTDDSKYKRQLFISSHHQETTEQLLHLLLPPKGYKMKFIEIKDWTPQKGPDFTIYDVTPTGGRGHPLCQAIGDTVATLLKGSVNG